MKKTILKKLLSVTWYNPDLILLCKYYFAIQLSYNWTKFQLLGYIFSVLNKCNFAKTLFNPALKQYDTSYNIPIV